MAIRKTSQPEVEVENEEKVVKETKPKLKKYVTNVVLNFREGPSKDSKVLKVLRAGDVVKVESVEGKWAKCYVDEKPGYVMTEYITAK